MVQRSYMPPPIQHQMQQALQRSLPQNLKQYADGSKYIPQQAQQAIQQHIEKNMPAHLKEYGGEFVRQQSLSGTMAMHTGSLPRPTQHVAPPQINPVRRDHSLGFGQQYNVAVDKSSGLPNQGSIAYTPRYQEPVNEKPTVTTPAGPPPGQYDFIFNGNNRPSESWLVHAPLKTRILVVGGGALVLLLVAWIVIALLSASGGTSARNLVAIAQEEAELVRISDGPAHNASLETTQNLASSTQLSVLSDEQSIIAYLQTVNAAPSTSDLAKNRNTQTDSQLLTAKADGTYDQIYISIAQHQLTVYSQNLKRTFDATGNSTERQLLSAAYHHAQLLLTQSKQS